MIKLKKLKLPYYRKNKKIHVPMYTYDNLKNNKLSGSKINQFIFFAAIGHLMIQSSIVF